MSWKQADPKHGGGRHFASANGKHDKGRHGLRQEEAIRVIDRALALGAEIELEIFAPPNPPRRVTHPEACGLRHLAFRVDSVEDTVRELEKLGIPCEPIRLDAFTGKKMTFFRDPDDLPLELHE